MGTSKSYNPPTSKEWQKLKNKVTRDSKQSSLPSEETRNIIRDYINTVGGTSRVSSGKGTFGGTKSAQHAASRLASFISQVNNVGFNEALRKIGLDKLEGKSVKEINAFLLNYFAKEVNTLDDVDARNAMSRLMDDLLAKAKTAEDVERIMNEQAQGLALNEILLEFFGYYLFEQFSRVFYERLVARIGKAKADSFFKNIEDYLKSKVKLASFKKDIKKIDWNGREGKEIIDNIFKEVLDVFGE